MTKEIVTIDEGETALEAARIMAERGISSLIVVKDGLPMGIITERDFVKKVCAKQLEPSVIKVGTLMSKIRTIADPDTPIQVAVQRMANKGIRRLPIIHEGKVVGIITVTDLARYLRTIMLLEGALSPNKTRGFWSASSNVDDHPEDDHDENNGKEGNNDDDENENDENASRRFNDNSDTATTTTATRASDTRVPANSIF
ncbi:MAG TPA: CBS domain-containing protein [Nitrososphaeraceae archaeon]|nr:CBS domain-containing protein [Nitrososphaeraceae archaeon]